MKAKRMYMGWVLVNKATGEVNHRSAGSPYLYATRGRARFWKWKGDTVRRAWLQWDAK